MDQMGGRVLKVALALLMAVAAGVPAAPAPADNDLAVQAREAWAKRDRKRLATLAEAARTQAHPLAGWVDYFELNARLAEVRQPEM
ncbi:MAG TPA: lytic transglycosylase domain-containing protein, partial [Roseateles sp.]